MSTNTARIGLVKPASSEDYDVSVVNANADRLDATVGRVVCTSTTRPSQPFPGMSILETDTGNRLVHDSVDWFHEGVAVVTNLSQILRPYNGQVVHNLTDAMLHRRSGTSWIGFQAVGGTTAATRHEAAYRQSTAQTGIANGADTRITWNANDYLTDDVSYSNGVFTINRGGLWSISATLRLAFHASGVRNIILATGANTVDVRYSNIIIPGGTTSTGNVSASPRLTAGSTIAVWLWQDSGASLSTDISFNSNRINFAWLRP